MFQIKIEQFLDGQWVSLIYLIANDQESADSKMEEIRLSLLKPFTVLGQKEPTGRMTDVFQLISISPTVGPIRVTLIKRL